MKYTATFLCLALLLGAGPAPSTQHYQVSGLVLSVDPAHRTVTVSHDAIPGYMEAMVMPYRVRGRSALASLQAGTKIGFTLVVGTTSSFICDIHVQDYDSQERDPSLARRLQTVDAVMRSKSGLPAMIERGQTVPDFSLVDQNRQPVTLSEFSGKVVAMTFIYTRCPLPDYCFRLSNNFQRLQKRFPDRMGRDLVLLSVTFDPDYDQPEVLAKYAVIWKADLNGWHFLTGPMASIKEVCGRFGMNFWPDEGLMTHSLRTVIIDRDRKLVANLEGNQYSAVQLGDLLDATLKQVKSGVKPDPR
jgi:protein SCO1